MEKFRKNLIKMLIMVIIILLMNSLMLSFSLWITFDLKVSTYIYFGFLLLLYLLITIPLLGNKYLFDKGKCIFTSYCSIIFFIFIHIFGLIILSINVDYYRKYLKQCPYLLNKLYYGMNLKRRCELFKINRNSNYAFQYICSYDSSKELGEKTVVCEKFKEIIPNNHIISLYIKEYINYDNYYCYRSNLPRNFTFVDPKNCNNKTKFGATITFYVFFLIQSIGFIPTFYIIGKTFNSLELDYFYGISERIGKVEENKKKVVEENNNRNANEINKNKENKEYLENSNKKEDNKINISKENINKESNEKRDNNNENKEENNYANNNNIENDEKNNKCGKNEINGNDKNFPLKMMCVVVEEKDISNTEKENNNTNISKDNKLPHYNAIHLAQIVCDFPINSEEDLMNKNIDIKK